MSVPKETDTLYLLKNKYSLQLQETWGDSGAIKAEPKIHSDRQKRTELAEAGPPGKPPHGNESAPFIYILFSRQPVQ
ncbi:MAG: hypothetical protein EA344_04705 [Alkalicoccus sp.]|nr:MAG: hypothetical protein EA344_04705 [Alkalicoccus sp.]